MRKSWLFLLVLVTLSCEQRTTVELSGRSPIIFNMSGSGRLVQLTVFGGGKEGAKEDKEKNFLWQLVQIDGDGERLSNIQVIKYGVVPSGYKQVLPRMGTSVEPLLENTKYSYRFVTMNAPHASGYFEIRNGVPIKVSGPCYEDRNGKWVRIDCPDPN